MFIFRERGREGEREGEKLNVWWPLAHTLLGTWPATQACALTGNQTSDPLVCRPMLNSLSYVSQGLMVSFNEHNFLILILSNLSPFSLSSVYFVSYLRNLCVLQGRSDGTV